MSAGSDARAAATSRRGREGALARCAVLIAWTLGLAMVLLWPQHRAGYGLAHDMVFTPRQPLSWSSVGLGSSSPRAVPLDALVAVLSRIADGAVLGRIALLVPLVAAGTGVAALMRSERMAGAVLATGFAVWNPYVVERLALGQWALLWSYAALPWIVRFADRMRTQRCGLAPLVLWLGAASITPTGGIIASAVAVVLAWPAAPRPVRDRVVVPAAAAVLQLPWVVPALLAGASATSDDRGVAAFAARGEHPGGALLALLGGGGIWDADVVPSSRTGLVGVLGLLVVVVALLSGWSRLRRVLGPDSAVRLAACAAGGLALAVLGSVPGGEPLLRWVVRDVPGAGLLRDGQKWIAPWVLLVALLLGAALARVASAPAWRIAAAAAAFALPLLMLPDATRVLRPTLDPVRYPRDWTWAAATVGSRGSVAVLPFQAYRSFPWAPGRTVLDPAPRLLPGTVVVSDRLAVSGRVLLGEDSRARAVEKALLEGPGLDGRLAALGVGWVLVERATPGAVPDLRELSLVRRGEELELYQVTQPPVPGHLARGRASLVLAANGLALAAIALAVVSFLPVGRLRLVGSRDHSVGERR